MTSVIISSDSNSVERSWMQWISEQVDPFPALRVFAGNYHYFSLRQVIAFSHLFSVVPITDRESLAVLGDVLHEELGRGRPEHVHSKLFERFAAAVGLDSHKLPWPDDDVVQGVRAYVRALNEAFGGTSLPRALATYQFLESSAVETYGPLLELLVGCGISYEALEFFRLHAQVEVEHAAAAESMLERAALDETGLRIVSEQSEILQILWRQMWQDIFDACKRIDLHD